MFIYNLVEFAVEWIPARNRAEIIFSSKKSLALHVFL